MAPPFVRFVSPWFFLEGCLKEREEVNNPKALQKLKNNILASIRGLTQET